MSGVNLLSAAELLQKGLEKGERTLPAKGQKEVAPSGAWVQQTQIQLALDARRQLLADERVEKWGILSRAEWDEELGLARVTENRGKHWAYLGHSRGKQLYLFPEEALFLMEVNCLELKFGGIQVSLQQGYSLLLRGKITILEYRVYSELSRVGYRVLRSTLKTSGSSEEMDDSKTSDMNTDQYENKKDIVENKNIIESTENNLSEGDLQCKNNNEVCYKKEVPQRIENNKGKDNTPNNTQRTKEENIQNQENVEMNSEKKNDQNGDDKVGSCNNVPQDNETKNIGNNKITEHDNDIAGTLSKSNEIIQNNENMDIPKNGDLSHNNTEDCNSEGKNNDKSSEISNHNLETGSELIIDNEDWKNFPNILVMGPELPDENMAHNNRAPKKPEPTTLISSKKSQRPPKSYRGYRRCKSKGLSSLNLPDYFKVISNLMGEDTVKVTAPDENYLPRNVFLNRTEYLLNIENIIRKRQPEQSDDPVQDEPQPHSRRTSQPPMHTTDPVMEAIFRNQFFRNAFSQQPQPPPFMSFPFFMFSNRRFQRFGPRNNAFRFAYNMFAQQRPYFPQRFNMPFQNYNFLDNEDVVNLSEDGIGSSRKRSHEDNHKKMEHLQSIRRLTCRLKKIQKSCHGANWDHLNSLKRLVEAYNSRYNENIQISDNLIILNDCHEGETIDLEEEEQVIGKRRKGNAPEQNSSDKSTLLESLKTLAARLKQLRKSGERCFRNRRSLLDTIKLYNKKFDTSIYLTSDFDIKDSQQIVLDSSSDSDCVVTDRQNDDNLRNTNIYRQPYPEEPVASTSKDHLLHNASHYESKPTQDFYDKFAAVFNKWLPSIEDWGRAEVVPSCLCKTRIINSNQEQYLYNYFNRYKAFEYRDWSQLKSDFWNTLEENQRQIQIEMKEDEAHRTLGEVCPCSIEPLLNPEDCTDIPTALQKIRIIKTHLHQDEDTETALSVTFDVYERDVKNFRKSDLSTPAFRLICLHERSPMPSVCELAALQRRCGDAAPLVVAAVGAGVSYVQMAPADLPLHTRRRYL